MMKKMPSALARSLKSPTKDALTALLCLSFSLFNPFLQLSFANDAPLNIPYSNSVSGVQIPPDSGASKSHKSSSIASVVELLNKAIGGSQRLIWKEVSSAQLPSGFAVKRYQLQLDDTPILNDWAKVQLNAKGEPTRIEYSGTHVESKALANLPNSLNAFWRLNETQIRQLLQTHGFRLPKRLQRVWFADNDSLQPAYFAPAISRQSDESEYATAMVFSAQNGALLKDYPIIRDAVETTFSYRVYASAPDTITDNVYGDSTLPHPTGSPGYEPPVNSFASQQLITVEELSNTVDDPWLPAGSTETVGNNVDVFFNSFLNGSGAYEFDTTTSTTYGPEYQAGTGDFRAPTSAPRTFDHSYTPADYGTDFEQNSFDATPANPSLAERNQLYPQIVQAFFNANVMHDIFYDAGFTESAGNAQQSNYGRGGIEGDPLIIHISNTTFIYTPADGESPVIRLGRSRGGSTAFDLSIFAHEWTHYMYRRLVEGETLISDQQSRALNEGWADVVGLLMTIKPDDIATPMANGFVNDFVIGSYFVQDYPEQQSMALLDPLYYGIRRWPYGPSNPFLFRHIQHAEDLPPTRNYSDYNGRSAFNAQLHTAGEIWANTVWTCFRDILASRVDEDFANNRARLAAYVVGGMIATPANPTYTEARNGLLNAIEASDTDDYALCRSAFVNAGMGSGALSPPRQSVGLIGVVESFADHDLELTILDTTLDDAIASGDHDGILDNAERGRLTLSVKNTGFKTINSAVFTLNSSAGNYTVFGSSKQLTDLAIGEEAKVEFSVRLDHHLQFNDTQFPIAINLSNNTGADPRNLNPTFAHFTHYDLQNIMGAGTINLELEHELAGWTQGTEADSFLFNVDPYWERENISNNLLLRFNDVEIPSYIVFDETFESPWMTANQANITINFDHAYSLPNDLMAFGGRNLEGAIVEYTLDGSNWLPVTDAVNYRGQSASYPTLTAVSHSISGLTSGDTFKIRFRINTISALDWQLDNLEILGVAEQPFLEAVEQATQFVQPICLPIIAENNSVASICL